MNLLGVWGWGRHERHVINPELSRFPSCPSYLLSLGIIFLLFDTLIQTDIVGIKPTSLKAKY